VNLFNPIILRAVSCILLFFFTWTFGGLFDIAYAVKGSSKETGGSSQQKKKEKSPEEKFSISLDKIEQILSKKKRDRSI